MAIYVSSKTFFSSRGHNLPWKLKVRSRSEVIRKKVYVCPEPTCIHHNPARALGDLTGMKKHFCRKHRDEKILQCNKCSKKYAIESDCKAHSKICGVRNFKCKCGSYISLQVALLKEKEKDAARRALMEKLVSVNHCSFSSLPINNNSALFQEHTSWGTCCNAKSFHHGASGRSASSSQRKEGFAAHIAMCDALALLKEKEKEVARRALMAKLVSVNHCSFSSLTINNNSALFQELIIKKQPTKTTYPT
ncbi:hypothetical protein Q3G72_001085 [Acer saccharum]|nr:hypothetical protein Q3G72_001085 [Acer saccharum]